MFMEKVGVITEEEVATLQSAILKYYNRNKNSLHPNWLKGCDYVIKHLNIIKHY